MQNSYIVDAFLSGATWVSLICLYFACCSQVSKLNALATPELFLIAATKLLKPSIVIAMPFVVILSFLLWRFYALMLASQTWGAGGIGLLVVMFGIGAPMIWLYVLLFCVRHSRVVVSMAPIAGDQTPPSTARGAYS